MAPRINLPPVTRALLGALLFQSLLSAAIRYRQWSEHTHVVIPYLTLVPQLSLVYPWTFLSTTLVENNVFTIAIGAATLYNGGRYLERAWSSAELAKFMAIVSLISNLATFLVMILFFSVTKSERFTYVGITCGLAAFASANLLSSGLRSSPARFHYKSVSSSHSASLFQRIQLPSSEESFRYECRDFPYCISSPSPFSRSLRCSIHHLSGLPSLAS